MSGKTIGRPMEILLVEDSLVDARFTMESLKQSEVRHRLTLVRDGEEALAFLRREGVFARAPRPDLILLDLLMPKLNGLDVLAAVRGDESLRDIPVVVLTAAADEQYKEQCEMLGVEGYITKPVELAKFLQAVRDLRKHWQSDLLIPEEGKGKGQAESPGGTP
jgi:chemotaxis family two-component system response regulator Rcp1